MRHRSIHRRPRPAVLAAAVAVTVGLAACGGAADEADTAADVAPTTEQAAATTEQAAATDQVVTIETFIFDPDPLTVPAGTTVTFENLDGTVHTVTAGTREAPERERFDAPLEEGATFEHTFDEPGTFAYFCDIHSGPGMTGEVVVEP